jgi:hypothetical protein
MNENNPAKFTIRCTGFRPLHRNTLQGFAAVTIAELKLEVHDIAIHEKNGKRWAQLPAKPQVRDGALIKDDSGKVQYTPVMQFASRTVSDAFSARVIEAVLDLFPEAFDDQGAMS